MYTWHLSCKCARPDILALSCETLEYLDIAYYKLSFVILHVILHVINITFESNISNQKVDFYTITAQAEHSKIIERFKNLKDTFKKWHYNCKHFYLFTLKRITFYSPLWFMSIFKEYRMKMS